MQCWHLWETLLLLPLLLLLLLLLLYLDCAQVTLIASEPQGMYLGNCYWHSDCIFMTYITFSVIIVLNSYFKCFWKFTHNYFQSWIKFSLIIIIITYCNLFINMYLQTLNKLNKDSASKLTKTITGLQANNNNKLTITHNLQETCLVWAWMKLVHCKSVHINTSIVQIIIELVYSEHLRQLKLPGRWQPRNEREHVYNPCFISNMTMQMMMM